MKNNMKSWKKWTLLSVILVAVIAVFVFLWLHSRPEPVVFETLTVQKTDIQKTTLVTGRVEPRDEVAVKPQISGIIAELYKEAGDRVKVGESCRGCSAPDGHGTLPPPVAPCRG